MNVRLNVFKKGGGAAVSLLLVLVTAASVMLPLSHVAALSSADFNPGHIIDDAIFTNNLSMSANDIQNFLNSKVTCDTNGTQSKSYYYNSSTGEVNVSSGSSWVTTSRTVYGQRYANFWNIHTSDSAGDKRSSTYVTNESTGPYVCLPNYVENPTNQQNNLHNPGASIAGGESAAQIIYNAAQTYQINPQVLIATLQKEQGLVTDSWPWGNEYEIAMGYACPDSAPCDSQYYGFANQINNGAAQFRRYLNNPTHYNYVVGNNYIQYSPAAGCGGSTVYIQNQATAALYDYTPYQPNGAALAGVSDSSPGGTATCGAYGNRNFWWYFNEWFGSSTSYYATNNSSVRVYTDSSKQRLVNADTIQAHQQLYIVMSFRNNGNITWSNSGNNPVHLAIMDDSPSAFQDPSWINNFRPAGMDQSSVGPGGIGTFSFWYTAPTVSHDSDYATRFGLVAEGAAAVLGDQPVVYTRVYPPNYQANNPGVTFFTDQSQSQQATANQMTAGNRVWAVATVRNNGSAIWGQDNGTAPIRLATSDSNNAFCDNSDTPTWISCSRAATMAESTVGPGGTATFKFWYQAPQVSQPGDYTNRFVVVAEGLATMTGDQPVVQTQVKPLLWAVNNSSVSDYTSDVAATPTPSLTDTMRSGNKIWVVMTFRNNGDAIWSNSGPHPVRLAIMSDSPAAFQDASWISGYRVVTMAESTVGPGGTATFKFWYQAPQVSHGSAYATRFGLVAESAATMVGDQPVIYTYVNP